MSWLQLVLFAASVLGCTAATFTNADIFARRINVIGINRIITTLETLGDIWFSTKVTSNNHRLVDHFATNTSEIRQPLLWYRTDDLNKTLEYYGLSSSKEVPYSKCYYHISTATYSKSGFRNLTAVISTLDSENDTLQISIATYISNERAKLICEPIFQIRKCNIYNSPLYYPTNDVLLLRAEYTRHCPLDSVTQFYWTLHDSTEAKLLDYLGDTMQPELTLRSFRLKLSQQSPLNRLVLIRINAKITGRLIPLVARCYLGLATSPIHAEIRGGYSKRVFVGRTLVLDASLSRDYSLPKHAPQRFDYRWGCTDIDITDTCKQYMGRGRRLTIPAYSQPDEQEITITLRIFSLLDPMRSSITTQTIHFTASRNIINVDIECVSNCKGHRYVQGKDHSIHLKAQCNGCRTKEIRKWTWRLNHNLLKSTTHRLIYNLDETEPGGLFFGVKVEATYRSELRNRTSVYIGHSKLHLLKNSGPTSTECQINPLQGEALYTKFSISCDYTETKFYPIKYCLDLKDLPVVQCTTDTEMNITLPATSEIFIKVCDGLDACTLLVATVNVRPLQIEDSDEAITKVLSEARFFLQYADWHRAFIIFHEVAVLTNTKERIMIFVAALSQYSPHTAMQLIHLMRLINRITFALEPLDDMEAIQLAKLMELISSTFNKVVYNGELASQRSEFYQSMVDDMCNLQEFFDIEREFVQASQCRAESESCLNIERFSVESERISFQPQLLLRINNWLHAHWQLSRCLFYVGIATAQRMHPDEKQKIFYRNTFTMFMESFELSQPRAIELKSGDLMHSLIFSTELLKELQKVLGTKEALVVVRSQKQSQFWWYPDQDSQTQELVVNIYTPSNLWLPSNKLVAPFQYISKLTEDFSEFDVDVPTVNENKQNQHHLLHSHSSRRYKRAVDFDEPEHKAEDLIKGRVHTSLEVRMYRSEVSGHSVLALIFRRAEIDYHVLLRMGYIPSISDMDNADELCMVKAGRSNVTLLMRNRCNSSLPVFIYLRAANHNENWTQYEEKGPSYEFLSQMRSCRMWKFGRPEPRWQTDTCIPAMNQSLFAGVHCTCQYLSAFDALSIPLLTVPMNLKCHLLQPKQNIDFNIVACYGLILAVAIVFIAVEMKKSTKYERQLYVHHLNSGKACPPGDIIVKLSFGGRYNAGTSANLIFSVMSVRGRAQFLVYQNQNYKMFDRNHTISFRLHRDYVELPLRLSLGHDNTGRYPTFFCRHVVVTDMLTEQMQIFRFMRWVRVPSDEQYNSSKLFHRTCTMPKELYKWSERFVHAMEYHMANWYLFEPVLGTLRFGTSPTALRRCHRSCIYMVKIFVTLCIVAIYFGDTQPIACDPKPIMYNDFEMVLWLSLVCFLAGCLVQTVMELLLQFISRHD